VLKSANVIKSNFEKKKPGGGSSMPLGTVDRERWASGPFKVYEVPLAVDAPVKLTTHLSSISRSGMRRSFPICPVLIYGVVLRHRDKFTCRPILLCTVIRVLSRLIAKLLNSLSVSDTSDLCKFRKRIQEKKQLIHLSFDFRRYELGRSHKLALHWPLVYNNTRNLPCKQVVIILFCYICIRILAA
jgi:hypothetical protein